MHFIHQISGTLQGGKETLEFNNFKPPQQGNIYYLASLNLINTRIYSAFIFNMTQINIGYVCQNYQKQVLMIFYNCVEIYCTVDVPCIVASCDFI